MCAQLGWASSLEGPCDFTGLFDRVLAHPLDRFSTLFIIFDLVTRRALETLCRFPQADDFRPRATSVWIEWSIWSDRIFFRNQQVADSIPAGGTPGTPLKVATPA
jgi:hypothetical protein